MGVLEGDLQLVVANLLQRVQKVLRQASCGDRKPAMPQAPDAAGPVRLAREGGLPFHARG